MDRIAALAVLVGLTLVPCAVAADDDPPERNRVHFQVERDAQVSNDRTTATLAISDEDGDPAELAGRINEAMRWGLERAKQVEAVTAHTGGYQTNPVHHEGKLRRWRARQELVLESEDAEALATLLGTLQERLQLSGIQHSVSPERRRASEDALIDEALAAFRARAERIRAALGLSSWEIVDLHVGTGGGGRPPMPQMDMMMAAESRAASPAIEVGTSDVRVFVNGSIALE